MFCSKTWCTKNLSVIESSRIFLTSCSDTVQKYDKMYSTKKYSTKWVFYLSTKKTTLKGLNLLNQNKSYNLLFTLFRHHCFVNSSSYFLLQFKSKNLYEVLKFKKIFNDRETLFVIKNSTSKAAYLKTD